MRRTFFRSRFIMFLSLILIPVVILGVIATTILYGQVKADAQKKSSAAVELMNQSMKGVLGDLDYYRVSIDYDSSMHIALISSLKNDELSYEDSMALRKAMQYRSYLDSIYVTMKGSSYLIADGSRYPISEYNDSAALAGLSDYDLPYWFRTRAVKRNHLDTAPTLIVSIYQKMKYNEVLIINIKQSYFDNWLNSVTDYEGQVLLILDPDYQVLFSSDNAYNLPEGTLNEAVRLMRQGVMEQERLSDYYFAAMDTSHFGLKYVSFIPEREVLRLPRQLIRITFLAAMFSLLLSSLLAVVFTSRDYRQIYQIIEVFDRAERGEVLPVSPLPGGNDAYFHIVNNVISLFVSQTYLKVQLDAKKYALLTAQLSALQYQLNPHFLFNTLQTVDLEILRAAKRPTLANEMIQHLSELLRYSLEAPLETVTVEREIAMTKRYVALQKARYGQMFEVIWDCAEEALDCRMLRLLLQPIIENSLEHAGLNEELKLLVKVKIRRKGEILEIVVADNGCGMEEGALKDLRERIDLDEVEADGRHIGLKNIAQRVRLGDEAGSLKIFSKASMGLMVKIRMRIINSVEYDTFS